VPTPHKRIPVIRDPELGDALERVAPYYRGVAPARIVHDLAVRGADAIVEERRRAEDAIERLVALSTEQGGVIDWDALARVDDLAWGE
jgi:hypothetical protein